MPMIAIENPDIDRSVLLERLHRAAGRFRARQPAFGAAGGRSAGADPAQVAAFLAGLRLFDAAYYRTNCPDAPESVQDAARHFVEVGAPGGYNPHPLFSTSYYLNRYPDVAEGKINPLYHFVMIGAAEGRDPHPLFSTTYYLDHCPEAEDSGLNPLEHYLTIGAAAGGRANPLFDPDFYRTRYPETAHSGLDPLSHYVRFGAALGHDPHPLFMTAYYVRQTARVGRLDENPLADFLRRGAYVALNPHPLFEAAYYMETHQDVLQDRVNPLQHFLETGARKGYNPSPVFDTEFYVDQVPEIRNTAVNPLIHFLESGADRSIDPHPLFIVEYYKAQCGNRHTVMGNPLVDYVEEGAWRLLNPNPWLDATEYVKRFPEAATHTTPLHHFLHTNAAANPQDYTSQDMTMPNANVAQACNNLGLGLFGLGLNQEANLAFRQAIAVDANFAEAYYNLANVLRADGKISQAIDYYNEALKRQPNLSKAIFDLGRTLAGRAQFDEAIAAFQKTLSIEPHHVQAAIELSTAYRLKGDLNQAVTTAEASLAFPNRTAECYFVLGLAQQARGNLDFAIGAYQHAVMVRPDYDAAHKQLNNLVVNIQGRRNAVATVSMQEPAWPQGFASSFNPAHTPEFAIACFHNIGDILLCTPVARQLKHDYPDCRIVWYTSEAYAFALKENPYVDEVVALSGGAPQGMYDLYEAKLRNERPWTRFISPAPYRNYSKAPFGNLLDLVRSGAGMEFTVPMAPVVRLTKLEEAVAKRYWDQLPEGRKILVECEFKSGQTLWDYSDTLAMIEALEEFDPVFVFTSKNKPAFLIDLAKRYPKVVWCGEAYRLNAYFFNNAAALIGVSSGISALVRSDYCRRDVPVIEFSKGEHWSAAIHEDADNLQVAFTRPRFRDALARLAAHFRGQTFDPDFSPRFPAIQAANATVERLPCPNCGSVHTTPIRASIVVKCEACQLVYLHERPKGSAEAANRVGVRTPSPDELRSLPRLPPSADAINTVEEYLLAQRREDFAQIEAAYGRAVTGKTFLEIGCGWGGMMFYAKQRGMNPVGFYATRRDREFAVNRLGLDVRDIGFMDADIPEGSVDLIVINGALDEVPYPVEFMQKVGYILAPRGVCMLTVPNLNSMFSWVLQELWWGFDPSRQSVFFRPDTLRDLLSQAGFHIKSCQTSSQGRWLNRAVETMRRWWPEKTFDECVTVLEQFDREGYGDTINVLGVKRAAPHFRLKGSDLSAAGTERRVVFQPVRRFLNGGGGIKETDLVGMLETLTWQDIRQVNLLDRSVLERLLALGWHESGPDLWASEKNASIGLKIAEAGLPVEDFAVTLSVGAPISATGAPLVVDVLINGVPVTQWRIPGGDWTTRHVVVPRRLIGRKGELVIEMVSNTLIAVPGNHLKQGIGLKRVVLDSLSSVFMPLPVVGEDPNILSPDVFGHISVEGFHGLEKWGGTWGVWSMAEESRLVFPVQIAPGSDLLLEAQASVLPDLSKPMQVEVLANDQEVAKWTIESNRGLVKVSARIPATLLAGQSMLSVKFRSSIVISPLALGISPDERKLGIGFARISLVEAPAEKTGVEVPAKADSMLVNV